MFVGANRAHVSSSDDTPPHCPPKTRTFPQAGTSKVPDTCTYQTGDQILILPSHIVPSPPASTVYTLKSPVDYAL